MTFSLLTTKLVIFKTKVNFSIEKFISYKRKTM